MRTFRRLIVTTLAAAALLAVATPAFAQGGTAPAPKEQGLGIFAQGGGVFTTSTGNLPSDFNPAGFLVGIGFGGNKSGAVGVGVDLNYVWLTDTEEGSSDSIRSQYLDIPVYARINIGGHRTKNAFTFYVPAGWFFDVLLSSKFGGEDIKDNFNGFQTGPMVGAGFEVARVGVEFRAQWALMDLLKTDGEFEGNASGKSVTYIVLFKVRLH